MKTDKSYLGKAKEIRDAALGVKKVAQPSTTQAGGRNFEEEETPHRSQGTFRGCCSQDNPNASSYYNPNRPPGRGC